MPISNVYSRIHSFLVAKAQSYDSILADVQNQKELYTNYIDRVLEILSQIQLLHMRRYSAVDRRYDEYLVNIISNITVLKAVLSDLHDANDLLLLQASDTDIFDSDEEAVDR